MVLADLQRVRENTAKVLMRAPQVAIVEEFFAGVLHSLQPTLEKLRQPESQVEKARRADIARGKRKINSATNDTIKAHSKPGATSANPIDRYREPLKKDRGATHIDFRHEHSPLSMDLSL